MTKYSFCKIFLIALFFSNSFISQDSLSVHHRFFQTQKKALLTLGGWSGANIVVSPFLKSNSSNSTSNFHQMNFNWNLVNAGIVGFSYLNMQKRKEKYWSINSLDKERKKLKTVLAVNIGLDACYILAGFLLRQKNDSLSSDIRERNIGFGNSLILQGGFLLLFDSVFLIKIKS